MNKNILKILIYSELINKNKINFNNINKNILKGGGRILKVNFNGFEYIFEESNIDDDHYILESKDGNNCVIVIISKKYNIAEIHGIRNFKSCIFETNQNVGSTLLKITLKMLKKYKNKFNIKMVILSDNSLKNCGNQNIKLSLMLTLLTGNTWYGKYGFRPIKFENNKYVLDTFHNELYNTNTKIIKKLKISDIKLLNFIKLTNNGKFIKACQKLLDSNPTMLLSDFLKNFISDFDKNCELFIIFYEQLFYKIMKYDPYHKLFGLNLE